MGSDVIIALISVGLGWGLSQLTEVIKSNSKKKELKLALISEIKDISFFLDKSSFYCDEFVDELNRGESIFRLTPAKVKTLVYDNYYHEIYISYNQIERINISLIYSKVDEFNKAIENYNPNNCKREYVNIYRLILTIKEMTNHFLEKPSISFSNSIENKKKLTAYINRISASELT